MTAHPLAAPLPAHARPDIPDPADVTPGIDEDVCVRCRKGNHEACVDYRQLKRCCCDVPE